MYQQSYNGHCKRELFGILTFENSFLSACLINAARRYSFAVTVY